MGPGQQLHMSCNAHPYWDVPVDKPSPTAPALLPYLVFGSCTILKVCRVAMEKMYVPFDAFDLIGVLRNRLVIAIPILQMM